jgi:hypothetical protein
MPVLRVARIYEVVANGADRTDFLSGAEIGCFPHLGRLLVRRGFIAN